MIFYGKPVAKKIYADLEKELSKLKDKNICPNLGVILVGEDFASLSYVRAKEKIAEKLGIGFRLFHLPGISSEKQVEKILEDLNQNKFISGIIVQLPLPKDFNSERILQKIAPKKDIDGFYGDFAPPTAEAILEILKFYQISPKGKKIVLLGYGRLVGKPLEKLLRKQGFEPAICEKKTPDLEGKLATAEIIVSATGVSHLIKAAMVKKEAVIIDAGTSEVGGKLAGDLDPEVYEKVKAYSPVPGGVGPVTVACLMRNVVQATKKP